MRKLSVVNIIEISLEKPKLIPQSSTMKSSLSLSPIKEKASNSSHTNSSPMNYNYNTLLNETDCTETLQVVQRELQIEDCSREQKCNNCLCFVCTDGIISSQSLDYASKCPIFQMIYPELTTPAARNDDNSFLENNFDNNMNNCHWSNNSKKHSAYYSFSSLEEKEAILEQHGSLRVHTKKFKLDENLLSGKKARNDEMATDKL